MEYPSLDIQNNINNGFVTSKKKFSRMYYIWCDESDSEGTFYSNFYGGILIRSMDLRSVISRLTSKISELNIGNEEIKWQKVNKRMYEPYKSLVDLIFDLLEEDLIKIRIFFRQNKYIPKYLNRQQMNEEYSMLYYQFIKHAFGFTGTRKRGVRTIMKEKLYKHINFRIRQLRRGFNIGMSTGFEVPFEIWAQPYRHWSFIPKCHEEDITRTKTYKKNNPVQPTE